MPPSPTEPEKYSIDEIMDRLKSAPSANPEDGELVIRSDGTQAIRVKKRKRRSSQPIQQQKKEARRVRILQVSAAFIFLFLAALVAGGAVIYANSASFREGLLRKIQETSGATAELEQFRMNPETANAVNLTLTWPDGNILQRLTARGLNAEVKPSSFFGKLMAGEELSAVDGKLELHYPQLGSPLRSFAPPRDGPSIRFNRYRIPMLQIVLGNPQSPSLMIQKTEASFDTETVNGSSQLTLYHGDITIPNWPKLRLDRALLEFRGIKTDAVRMRLLHETDFQGEMELSGTVYPTLPDRISSLDVALDSFEISGIIGPLLGRLCTGRIDTQPVDQSNFISFQPVEGSSPVLEISFAVSPSSRMELAGFPFLKGLAQAIDDPWFQEPVFETDATGTIDRSKGNVTLRKLNFENKARMACRGEIKMANNQQLTGNLEVGVAEAMIGASKNIRLKSIFSRTENGFRWLNLKIAGTATNPTDNFKELLATATTTAEENRPSMDDPTSLFDELTRPK